MAFAADKNVSNDVVATYANAKAWTGWMQSVCGTIINKEIRKP
jgi:hypothetical protein